MTRNQFLNTTQLNFVQIVFTSPKLVTFLVCICRKLYNPDREIISYFEPVAI